MEPSELFALTVEVIGINMVHDFMNETDNSLAITADIMTSNDNITVNAIKDLGLPPLPQLGFHTDKETSRPGSVEKNMHLYDTSRIWNKIVRFSDGVTADADDGINAISTSSDIMINEESSEDTRYDYTNHNNCVYTATMAFACVIYLFGITDDEGNFFDEFIGHGRLRYPAERLVGRQRHPIRLDFP